MCTWYAHCMYSEYCVGYKQTHEIRLAVYALTSIFSSPAELNLFKILPAPSPTLHQGISCPQWLEYRYRTAHPVLRWLPTKGWSWAFQTKLIGGHSLALDGLRWSSTIYCNPTSWTVPQRLGVWNWSLSCSGALCVQDAILSKCQ